MTKREERLIESAKQALAIAKGEAPAGSYRIHVAAELDVKAIRKRQGMTQEEFATSYGLGLARLKDWEQGRSKPVEAQRAYLLVIDREPEAVRRALSPAHNDNAAADFAAARAV